MRTMPGRPWASFFGGALRPQKPHGLIVNDGVRDG